MKKTNIDIGKALGTLAHSHSIVTIGSCFSDMLAGKLSKYKWQLLANPYGTIYDPLSISNNLTRALEGIDPRSELFGLRDDVHFHYHLHSNLSALSFAELATMIANTDRTVAEAIRTADWLVITFGSMIAYRHKSTAQVVANCHKMPQSIFDKVHLTVEEVHEAMELLIEKLRGINPNLRVLVTVSPVRHARHGLPENMLSKSQLRLLCDMLVMKNTNVSYFPSFEIMMDDLRDYAYYKADGIHPNEIAEDYIWEKFKSHFLDSETQNLMEKWDKISSAIAHKPLHPNSKSHQNFIRQTIAVVEGLRSVMDVSHELELLNSQLQ